MNLSIFSEGIITSSCPDALVKVRPSSCLLGPFCEFAEGKFNAYVCTLLLRVSAFAMLPASINVEWLAPQTLLL